MNTDNINKTNIIEADLVSEIERELGKEIVSVYTYKKGMGYSLLNISPDTCLHNVRHRYGWDVTDIRFDESTMILTVRVRTRYARSFNIREHQFQKIGYKLPTSKLRGGWIYGIVDNI